MLRVFHLDDYFHGDIPFEENPLRCTFLLTVIYTKYFFKHYSLFLFGVTIRTTNNQLLGNLLTF